MYNAALCFARDQQDFLLPTPCSRGVFLRGDVFVSSAARASALRAPRSPRASLALGRRPPPLQVYTLAGLRFLYPRARECGARQPARVGST